MGLCLQVSAFAKLVVFLFAFRNGEKTFESIVVELLTAMGYGDGEVTQSTNDEGLDGIIKEDKLALDNIYDQAKRWINTVGRPDIMAFVGALEGRSASKMVDLLL